MTALAHLDLAARGVVFDALAAGPRARSAAGGGADADTGEPVLLLHGFPQTSASWRHQLAALGGDGHRVVAFDQRGYSPGARPAGVAAYRIDELVGDVLAVADVLGWDTFHLAGHDWGGVVAWHVAARRPERLRTLTVASTPHPRAYVESLRSWDQRRRSAYVPLFRSGLAPRLLAAGGGQGLRLFLRAAGLSAAEAAPYVAALGDVDALRATLTWYRAVDLRTAVCGRVSVPTAYVWSTEDPALGRDAAAGTARHVDGPYRFVVLDGVSHWIPEHAGDALTAVLRDQLAAERQEAP